MRRLTRYLVILLTITVSSLVGSDELDKRYPPALVRRMRRQQARRHPDVPIEPLLPYIHGPVTRPVGDGVSLAIPKELGNQRLAKLGFVDVTASPFNADPTGKKDATAGLQAAVDCARDHQMVCWFPSGRYRISDTLTCVQGYYLRQNGAISGAPNFPCVLMGSTRSPDDRAVLLLAPRSPGFTDPAHPKIVVHFTNRSLLPPRPHVPQANVSFRQVFTNIDIEIGPGNTGAIGLRMQAAEGSTVQDVTIDARHGDCGMRGAAGSGGSHHNITVLGGRVGIDTHGWPPEFRADGTGTQPTPTMAHVTLRDQRETAIIVKSRGPFVAVGWRISGPAAGPLIRVERGYASAPFNGSLAMIDCVIERTGTGSTRPLIQSERSVYLRNVYTRKAAELLPGVKGNSSGWARVVETASVIDPVRFRDYVFHETVYVDGHALTSPLQSVVAMNRAPPDNLCSCHVWPRAFPWWDSPGTVNVKDPPYGARGDSITDDTAALQQAIDTAEIVFLPRGYYRISRTLKLGPKTKLIGAGQHLSVILVREPRGAFADPSTASPLILTADDPHADTVLAFLELFVATIVPADYTGDDILGYHALTWQCGGTSIFRQVQVSLSRLHGFGSAPAGSRQVTLRHPAVHVRGHGGGSWYNFYIHGYGPYASQYRHLLVADTLGVPLRFYHLHAQYSLQAFQCELRNARNVSLFGVKTEYQTGFMRIAGCDNIRIFGHGGNGKAAPGAAHYIIEATPNFLLSNLGDQPWLGSTQQAAKKAWIMSVKRNIRDYYPLIDRPSEGPEVRVPSLVRPLVYRRGHPP